MTVRENRAHHRATSAEPATPIMICDSDEDALSSRPNLGGHRVQRSANDQKTPIFSM
jgi:hypothetical protein